MDHLWNFLIKRPYVVAMFVVLGIGMLPLAVWLDLRNISDQSLRTQASNLITIISDIRNYYATNVVGRIRGRTEKTQALHNYYEVAGAIPTSATLSVELGQLISAKRDGIGYRFVSDLVFSNRKPHDLDDFERKAIATFRTSRQENKVISEVVGSIFDRRVRMAVPVVMSGVCVNCHNSHPQSPKKDWKIGEVRGIQIVSIEQPIAANIKSFQFLFGYLLIAGTIGITFSVLQWRQANNIQKLNGFLEQISVNISKYLPPQVYNSIFSGERDVSISTERKKLTVFISDIKDFTLASETLQPEEITLLLNEYFTEMSNIAAEHGATLDKFIGDGILAFFGDPETKGVREDARSCVRMAMAMQRRLDQLNQEWKLRGIERPFLARMGINTGYCNVGNFGSADRMDYTIIGAEANLAARLEAVSPPSGIVMSYETFAHVSDMIEAEQLQPITLKGIAREIVPYSVQNILDHNTSENASDFVKKAPGVTIDIQVARLDDAEAQDARVTLEAALRAIHQRSSEKLPSARG